MIVLICLSVLFVVNLILLAIVWDLYGEKVQGLIAKKDVKEQVLEQLRQEAFDLKLPKEHSPRI